MKKLTLTEVMRTKFETGIRYPDAVELCVAIFCSVDWLPEVKSEHCSKSAIAAVFGSLAKEGFIFDFSIATVPAAQISHFTDKRHWLEVLDNAMKSDHFYDSDKVKELLE